MKNKPEYQLTAAQLQAQHVEVQATCNKTLGMACLATEMARGVAYSFKIWQKQMPAEEMEKLLNYQDIGEWLPQYLKLSELEFAEQYHLNKPSIMRKAMEILEIIPQGA
jgi:hypothetical protein